MNSPIYKHTQVGYLMIAISVVIIAFYSWLYMVIKEETGPALLALVIMALVVFILASFSSLTVTIDEQNIRIKFGYGIFKKKFSLGEIVSVTTVKNKWYYGWGIKVWFWPYMWIYSVSGFDAVEITMKNGRVYRIGTDDAPNLLTAIKPAK